MWVTVCIVCVSNTHHDLTLHPVHLCASGAHDDGCKLHQQGIQGVRVMPPDGSIQGLQTAHHTQGQATAGKDRQSQDGTVQVDTGHTPVSCSRMAFQGHLPHGLNSRAGQAIVLLGSAAKQVGLSSAP